MANPRQRRKTRSGSHKPVQHSKRAKKLQKKQPPIRGPQVLQEAWDARKTVRQNYEALGLVASLNPIASGGTERAQAKRADDKEAPARLEAPSSTSTRPAGTNGVPKGFGKIIRDAEGNVVDVQLAVDEEVDEAATEGEGVDEGVPDPRGNAQLAGWVEVGSDPKKAQGPPSTAGTRQLSEARAGPVPRHTSKGEHATLQRLIAKHGEDVEAMARDVKLNVDQRTAGELKRAIRKAGGSAALGRAG
ncbi:hypothetical protein DICSQDRAFT_48838 [Dichomitus squalens LYAD-421 SS1]|uniref:uncharacterized protein n=1 Tax=Dichomitus squalens (strain LYAD-421) TaxID=732165 RepID=UPI0004412543|nr:uncharacterized protein DICSQDRAFT_48838 [Dichomitus squalens LYAD-421 SS1]EJF65751.1 hypothetical protein DICSQDRAFT_48838 [Dichomitus squalens LYAD-421 SS1]